MNARRLSVVGAMKPMIVANTAVLSCSDRRMTIEVTEEACRFIARQGFDPVYGARPLRRFIAREVETRIGEQGIISGLVQVPNKIHSGDESATDSGTMVLLLDLEALNVTGHMDLAA